MLATIRLAALLAFASALATASNADSPKCDCPIQAALSKLPALIYDVAGEVTDCDQHAAELAKEKSSEIYFVVQQTYDSQPEAQQALVAATEALLSDLTTPHKCAKSGVTSIAGKNIECPTSAAKVADAVKQAVEAVHVSYKVGDKECSCPHEAKELADETGAETKFVVGDQETCCPIANQLNLARAKYRVALETINSAEVCNEASAEKCTKCKGCPIEAGLKNLPSLAFVVGKESTDCPQHAADLAAKSDAAVQYVVRRKFHDKQEAMVSLVNATEALVDQFATPVRCDKSGVTTVAGQKLECRDSAAKIADSVHKAIDSILVSYEVDGEQCHCPLEAAALAKKSGAETIYVVNGEKTTCELTNRLNVARAKYRAAVEAVAKQAGSAKKSASSQS